MFLKIMEEIHALKQESKMQKKIKKQESVMMPEVVHNEDNAAQNASKNTSSHE